MLTPEAARERGVALPTDDAVAQDIIDEWEAWLARRIGPLEGSRTETFYVGISATYGKLGLRRYTSSVAVTDGGVMVDTDHYRLVDNGGSVVRKYESPSQWWTGPYVAATYTPNDEAEVRRVLLTLLKMAVDPHADSPYNSEQIGQYSYSKGGSQGAANVAGQRAALASSLLPKRDPMTTIILSSGRGLLPDDPVINRAEAQV
jgi:hypothetical protein